MNLLFHFLSLYNQQQGTGFSCFRSSGGAGGGGGNGGLKRKHWNRGCGSHCWFAVVLWCEYCSASFQSFVLRYLIIAPVRNTIGINLVPRAFPLKNGWGHPFFKGKALGTRLHRNANRVAVLPCAIALSTLLSLLHVNACTADDEVEILLFNHKKFNMGVV